MDTYKHDKIQQIQHIEYVRFKRNFKFPCIIFIMICFYNTRLYVCKMPYQHHHERTHERTWWLFCCCWKYCYLLPIRISIFIWVCLEKLKCVVWTYCCNLSDSSFITKVFFFHFFFKLNSKSIEILSHDNRYFGFNLGTIIYEQANWSFLIFVFSFRFLQEGTEFFFIKVERK